MDDDKSGRYLHNKVLSGLKRQLYIMFFNIFGLSPHHLLSKKRWLLSNCPSAARLIRCRCYRLLLTLM